MTSTTHIATLERQLGDALERQALIEARLDHWAGVLREAIALTEKAARRGEMLDLNLSIKRGDIAALQARSSDLEQLVVTINAEILQLRSERDALQAEHDVLRSRSAAPRRERLPSERSSITHRFEVAGHEGYVIAGTYPDGRLGEMFIVMAKQGSTIGALMDAFAIAISIALQYGVPLADLVRKFSNVRFEPAGFTGSSTIPFARSPIDYVFRWLALRFNVAGEEMAQAELPLGVGARQQTPVRQRSQAQIGSGPICRECGMITQPSGKCYVCPQCGQTTGCS